MDSQIIICPHWWAMNTQTSTFSLSHTNRMIDIYLSSKSWTSKIHRVAGGLPLYSTVHLLDYISRGASAVTGI